MARAGVVHDGNGTATPGAQRSDRRPGVLLLVHRIPFPPNKGDKIRSYHLLRHLAERHEVHLGAFVDDPQDWQHEAELARLCHRVHLVPLDPRRRKFRSLAGLLSGQALSVPYYASASMQRWVDRTVADEGIDRAVVFSSTMGQFLAGQRFANVRRVADMCDVDSDKWRQYAEGKRGVMRWIYAREGRTLLDFERRIAGEFDATLFVTSAEADLFRSLAPESAHKVGAYDNGVDAAYFDPGLAFDSPYVESDRAASTPGPVAVFTGAMDYWPNVDAVTWFCDRVWPLVLARAPAARFFIVGSKPGPDVTALAQRPGVHVTGRVPDVRPWLAHADVAVAPLRIARGTQNKVLEALAMAKPVACTEAAAAGLQVARGPGFRVADDAAAFADDVHALFAFGQHPEGRNVVLGRYRWSTNLRVVDALVDGSPIAEATTLAFA